MVNRLIDPLSDIERAADARHGVTPQGELRRSIEQGQRFDADPARSQLIVVQETITGYRANPAANTSSDMFIVLPTASATFDTIGRNLHVAGQARVLLVRITANANVTAGTAMPEIAITEGGDVTTVSFNEATLDVTNNNSRVAHYDWDVAQQIALDATIVMRVKTDAAYAPTTLDIAIQFVLGYENWI